MLIEGARQGWSQGACYSRAGYRSEGHGADIDYSLDGRRWQFAVVTACGCVVAILIAVSFHISHLLLTGAAGGLSMAFCSWITNQSWSTADNV